MAATKPRSSGRPGDRILDQYLTDIGRWPLLTAAEEQRLGLAIKTGQRASERLVLSAMGGRERTTAQAEVLGGRRAATTLLQANLRLVVAIARRYQASGVTLADLVQEGNLGLLRAVEGFDVDRGFRFTTYATWWIRQAIQRGISYADRAIRLPSDIHDDVDMMVESRGLLQSQFQRTPTVDEIAASCGKTVPQIQDLLVWAERVVSLDEPVGQTDRTRADLVADLAAGTDDQAVRSDTPRRVSALLSQLTERERRVVVLRYGLDGMGLPRSLLEVGALVNLSSERVRQIGVLALAKLRHPSCRDCGITGLLE